MILANHLAWLRQAWPFAPKRARLLGEYARLQACPAVLADIALRGGVGKPAHRPGQDVHTSIWNDGRRALAEEILALAGCDPRTVEDMIEQGAGHPVQRELARQRAHEIVSGDHDDA